MELVLKFKCGETLKDEVARVEARSGQLHIYTRSGWHWLLERFLAQPQGDDHE